MNYLCLVFEVLLFVPAGVMSHAVDGKLTPADEASCNTRPEDLLTGLSFFPADTAGLKY